MGLLFIIVLVVIIALIIAIIMYFVGSKFTLMEMVREDADFVNDTKDRLMCC